MYCFAFLTREFRWTCALSAVLAGPSLTWSAPPAGATPYVVVLGIAQDAGYPQAGCRKDCCRPAWKQPAKRRLPSCIAVVNPSDGRRWMFDCTPAFPTQLRKLDEVTRRSTNQSVSKKGPALDGIFLTHGHIGHYAGLIHLGREVMGTRQLPVYAMPRMGKFLESNGPWSLLVRLKNIQLRPLRENVVVRIGDQLSVTPILVPHRDEFSETVAFLIRGPNRTLLYLPDIDKWQRWNRRIEAVISKVDVALLDGTFYANGELPGRDMSRIPHPFIEESIQRFTALPIEQRGKIRFIHLNHTNPALQPNSAARKRIARAGMAVAREGERIGL